jgi:hypothetical protein
MSPTLASASRQVFRNDYYTVLVEERLRLVRVVRSEKPFATIPELEVCFAQLIPALDALDRPRYVLLSDVRAVPGRNDPEFEAALARVRPLWLTGFRKVGVLVQSSVGLLQVQRYARKDGLIRKVSNDEAELLEYLLSPEA